MTTDSADLLEYCTSGSESAFRRLVESHAPMVHGVASRMLRNAPLAEEVTQSVFVILARKARSIPPGHLPGWLHNTATRESRNARRKEARRHALNHQYTQAMNLAQEPTADPSWNAITPHLDEAVARLSHEDRQLMVLRYFEQRNFHEIAAAMGCSEEACKKRSQRALNRLGNMLRERGVTAGIPAIGTAVAAFALLPPSASAASIASFAVGSASAAGGGTPSLFKLIQYMTTKHATTVAAAPAFKLLTALPPILALSAGVLWTVSQDRAIASLDREAALYQRALDLDSSRHDAGGNPGAAAPKTATAAAKPPNGRIDWKTLGANPSDLALSVAIKRRMQSMSASELMAQLDEIDKLDLGDKAALEEIVMAWLANKDPKALVERYSDRVGGPQNRQALVYAFGNWSHRNTEEAAQWLDRKVAEGVFDNSNSYRNTWGLQNYEYPVVTDMMKIDPQAAEARLEAYFQPELWPGFHQPQEKADAQDKK
jgi:RNA polymerase sigma factor (sigma-70 family)